MAAGVAEWYRGVGSPLSRTRAPVSEISLPSPSRSRPSLRKIAAQLGISHATVSLALRNHAGVSSHTRDLVQRTAEQLGYRPNPQGAKPIHQVAVVRQKKLNATLAAITDHVEAREPYHVAALRFGAQHAATALGYRLEVFRVRVRERRYWILDKMLRNPDVEGILLFPTVGSVDISNYVDWKRLPVIATTHQVTAPEFHRVVADQRGNTLSLCEHLVSLGHRRLGYVGNGMSDHAPERRLAEAVSRLNAQSADETITLSLHPGLDRSSLRDWFDLERPEVIVTETDVDAEGLADELGAKRRQQVQFAIYEHAGSPRWSGIDHRYRAIGAAAVSQLHARIQSGEKGIPDVPTTMTIKGEWVEAIDSDVAIAS